MIRSHGILQLTRIICEIRLRKSADAWVIAQRYFKILSESSTSGQIHGEIFSNVNETEFIEPPFDLHVLR